MLWKISMGVPASCGRPFTALSASGISHDNGVFNGQVSQDLLSEFCATLR